MKAAVLYRTNDPLQIKDLQQESPKYGEVRVKMSVAGICASDHHVMTGSAVLPLPVVAGHEGSGIVTEIGDGVKKVKPGDRCILSFVSNCGHCKMCRTGDPQLCDTNSLTGAAQYDGSLRLFDGDTGVYQMAKLGVFSESVIVPEQACFVMADEVPMDVGALIGCCVTTGVGAVVNHVSARPGMTAAIFGCGGVGLNVIQGAKLMNASRIIAIDIYDHKLEFSYKFGATDVINSRETDPVEAIKEMTGSGVDMAFDSFGSSSTTNAAVRALRKKGVAIMIGLAPVGDTAPIDMVDLLRNQKTLVGSYYGSESPHESFKMIQEFYLKGDLVVDSLITRRYKLDQINEGFDALDRGEDGRGVIVY